MTARLVLGCGLLSGPVVDALSDRPGTLSVVADDETAVQTLREEGVAAEVGDVTDPAVVGTHDPATVVVTTDDPRRNAAAARTARAVAPEAFILAYTGRDPPPEVVAALEGVADEVVDPAAVTAERVREAASDGSVRARKLLAVLRDLDGRLAVVAHDNPDPDAIASAVALERIAGSVGTPADVCYFGDISHQENRALVNLLELDLHNLEPGADLSEYAGVALVDHSRAGVNDGLPEDTPVDVVIDHHPPRMPVEARFVDLRSEVGATSTLLVDYLRRLSVSVDETTATGLLFGIRVDTDEFTREVCPEDFEAAAYLLPHADLGTLERVDSPSVSADTLETIGRAIRNRRRHGPALVTGVGTLADRDALAQAADQLLDLEGVTTTFVHGIADGTVYVSARSRGSDVDLGETLRDAFDQIGSAGGHADMAGAQIPLGLLADVDEDEESLAAVVDDVVTDRFLESFDSRTHQVIRDVYPDDFHGPGVLGSDEYAPDAGEAATDRGDGGASADRRDDSDSDGSDPTEGRDGPTETGPGSEGSGA